MKRLERRKPGTSSLLGVHESPHRVPFISSIAAALPFVAVLIAAAFLATHVLLFSHDRIFSHDRMAREVDQAFGATLEPLDPLTARSVGLPPRSSGLIVTSIARNGPAAKAGIRTGDVIVRADGHVLRSQRDLAAELRTADGSTTVTLNRHGQFAMVALAIRTPAQSGETLKEQDQR